TENPESNIALIAPLTSSYAVQGLPTRISPKPPDTPAHAWRLNCWPPTDCAPVPIAKPCSRLKLSLSPSPRSSDPIKPQRLCEIVPDSTDHWLAPPTGLL